MQRPPPRVRDETKRFPLVQAVKIREILRIAAAHHCTRELLQRHTVLSSVVLLLLQWQAKKKKERKRKKFSWAYDGGGGPRVGGQMHAGRKAPPAPRLGFGADADDDASRVQLLLPALASRATEQRSLETC